jgi:hypothetical protein
MLSNRLSATRGNIGRLEVNNIKIIRDKTKLKWSGRLKNRDIKLVGNGSTAKLSLFKSGEKAVLGSKGVVIGTDNLSWSLTINKGSTIQCGMALSTRNLNNTDVGSDLISTELSVEVYDRIVLVLNSESNTLVITNGNTSITLNTTPFSGQTMYPWVSDVIGTTGFIIKINEYQVVNMTIDTAGTARINTITETNSVNTNSTAPLIIDAGDKGIDLGAVNVSETNIKSQPGEDFSVTAGTSGQGLTVQDPDGDIKIDTKIQVDNIEPKSGSTSLTIKGGGVNGVTIDNVGDVTINSGSVITSSVKALPGSATSITNDSGVGVHVSDAGIVTFDITPKFDEIKSNTGNDLTLLEGTSGLGIEIEDTTGNVNITGTSMKCNILDTTLSTTMTIGATTASKIEISQSGIDTEIKGNLDAAEGVDVTGNISVTGTVDGVDIVSSTIGLVSVHSDININTPVDNDILQYDNSSSEWVNRNLTTAGVAPISHTHSSTNITDFNSAADARITLQKGNVNGLASLDGSGKVPLNQLSLNSVEYKGTWDADTNTPTLSSGSGSQGNYYVVTVTGATNLDGISEWVVGDWSIYNGTAWEKVDNTDSVTSVAGKQGAVSLQATDLTDVTDVGSGAIITGVERTQIGTNNTNATGSVLIHSDVTDAGSGYIITDAERTLIGTNNTNATGPVTVHSDVTDAGSGAIITSGERTILSNLGTTYLALSGGTMGGAINMNSNDITNANDVGVNNDVTVGNTLTVTGVSTFQDDCKIEGDLILGTGTNAVTLSSGLSSAPRAYSIQDKGSTGTLAVIKKTEDIAVASYTSDQTLVIPAGVTQIQVKLWGAGGTSGVGGSNRMGGSGGGGGYSTDTISVVPGDTYQLTIGNSNGGGSGGVADAVRVDHGGNGGGMTMLHHFTGGMYNVIAVAAGGGGGVGSSGLDPIYNGGPSGQNGGGSHGGGAPVSPPLGGVIAVGALVNGGNGFNFNDPVASIGSVGGNGGFGAGGSTYNREGSGGGGSGYGGGAGGSLSAAPFGYPSGGGGGANFGSTTVNGSGTTPGNNSDTDKQNVIYGIQTSGTGGPGIINSQSIGVSGAALIYFPLSTTYSISLKDDDIADSTPATDLIIHGTDKIAGTGNGGNLTLQGGTSVGGVNGFVEIDGKVKFTPQTEPLGVAGDVYYDSGTNKLRIHNGTSWGDLH